MILFKLILSLININIILNQEFYDELATYRIYESFVELKGGEFLMGINDREGVNYEYPQRKARVKPFRITLYPTTIGSFKKFKKEKYKYKTDAELTGSSWVFTPLINELEFNKTIDSQIDDIESQESINLDMRLVSDARWNKPEGGKSSIKDRLNYPVVHVSFNDAFAYCAWKGMRLPTEIEWEFAARGTLREMLYPWGDKWELGRANLWQGKFPFENQLRDSYYGLSPVNAFNPQNNYEMFDLIGNIWEWTSTKFRDFRNETNLNIKKRVLKGGSFLDKRDGDNNGGVRIRTSARIARTEKYTSYNIGFRCAQTIQQNEQLKFENNLNYRIVKLRPPKKHSFHNTKFEL